MKNFLITFFLTINCHASLAQIKEIGLPSVKNFSRKEYNAENQTWQIDQDLNKNVFFANNGGLLRFDGISWKKISMPNSVNVRSLKINGHKIFVGGYNEFGYFEVLSNGNYKYYSLSKFLEHKKPIEFIWKIHLVDGATVFQSFQYLYFYKNKKIKAITAPSRFQFSFLANNQLFVQDKKLGLLRLENGVLKPMSGTETLNNTEVWGVFPKGKTELVIATLDKGLFLFSDLRLKKWQCEANSFLEKNSGLGGAILQGKNFAFNSVLDGMIIVNQNGKIIQHLSRKNGIQNNTVLTSFVDNDKNLWLGLDNGISHINVNSKFSFFGSDDGISTTYGVANFNQKIYVATNQGMFCKELQENSNKFELVQGTTGQAWNIQMVGKQLFCAHNRGLLVVENKIARTIFNDRGYWGVKGLSPLNYFVAANYDGFAIFEKNGPNFQLVKQLTGVGKTSKDFFVENNSIWFIDNQKLKRINLSKKFTTSPEVQVYSYLTTKNNAPQVIASIAKQVTFLANNKCFYFDYKSEKFIENKTKSSLFKNLPNLNFLYEDQFQNIWYGHSNTIGALKKTTTGFENDFSQFSELDGDLVSNYLSISCVDSNNYFIGLSGGLAHFGGFQKTIFSKKPKVFINSFECTQDTIVFGNLSKKDTVFNLSYSNNDVKFGFSSPLFSKKNDVQFSYKLEGFDKKYCDWTTMHFKEYTNLREGKYKMLVRVRKGIGNFSEDASIQFKIKPPWYRSTVAYMLYVLAFGMMVFGVHQSVQAKIRKNKYFQTVEQRRIYLEKEAKIRAEQQDLETEIERLKNEKLKIKLLSKDKELVNNSLQVVKKNKVLNEIVQSIKKIDTNNLTENAMSQIAKVNKTIAKEVDADQNWKTLEKHIKNVHFEFLKRLKNKYPTISPRELDLSTYLLMNMSTKEIAEIMNISNAGVELARYRLRKKLNLTKKENLTGFLLNI